MPIKTHIRILMIIAIAAWLGACEDMERMEQPKEPQNRMEAPELRPNLPGTE